MRPAGSILLLTTLTGFAFGLLAWIGVYAALGLLPAVPGAAVVVASLATVLCTAMIHASLGRRA
jgi:hypothetical protein